MLNCSICGDVDIPGTSTSATPTNGAVEINGICDNVLDTFSGATKMAPSPSIIIAENNNDDKQIASSSSSNLAPEPSNVSISRSQRFRNSNLPDEDFDIDETRFARLNDPVDETRLTLDPYNADLNFQLNLDDRLSGDSLSQDGFAFMLAGIRATHGFNSGRVGFEIKMLDIVDVSDVKPEETYPFEMRVGWSTCESTLRLGESGSSFGYCNNGRTATSNRFVKVFDSYDIGDVVACLVDFEALNIRFTLNGKSTTPPVAFNLPEEWAGNSPPLFPHICVKNVKFVVNFGRSENPWFGLPEGFVFVDDVPLERRHRGPLPPQRKEDCKVLCLIGLPASGKTEWVKNFLRSAPSNENWMILSTYAVLDQMKVQGVVRKKLHPGRWDMMMGVVVKCLNRLLALACRMRKNYIFDMSNVYPLPRRKKMAPFTEYKKKAIVLVPTVEHYANRCHHQMMTEGKQIPSDALLEMKACFELPKEEDGVFDEIEFVELQRDDAQKVVEYFNEEGKAFKPREKRRRADWQQEELPPKQPKTSPTISGISKINNNSASTTSKQTHSYPYGMPASLRTYTASSSSQFTRQWSTPFGMTTNNHVQQQHSQPQTPTSGGWSQQPRTATSGYIPRAGWPANWPQASWNQPAPTPNQLNGTSTQFAFPSPSSSTSS